MSLSSGTTTMSMVAAIKWVAQLQLDNVVIWRSAKPERVVENLDVFDFELADEHADELNG
jgi:diketogulonate reductase-like aldo/keto reductase